MLHSEFNIQDTTVNKISIQSSKYETETDDASISPTSTWWSSRRSSSSSSCSLISHKSIRQTRSFPDIKHQEQDECELKQALKQYKTIFHKMAMDIDDFLTLGQRKQQVNMDHVSTIERFNKLKDMVFLIDNKQETTANPVEVTHLLKFIENWMCVTQDKRISENVLEQDRLMKQNERLIQALNRLGKQHGQMKNKVRQLERRALKLAEEKEREVQRYQARLNKSTEDKAEAEQLLDDMRKEMEDMLEELDGVKQQSEQYREKSSRLEQDIQNVISSDQQQQTAQDVLVREAKTRMVQLEQDLEDRKIKMREIEQTFKKKKYNLSETHRLQVAALTSEKEELRQRLVKAELLATEYAKSLETEKKRIKVDTELEHALRQSAAEKEKELARVRAEFDKSQRHVDQMKTFYDKQLERELKAHEDDMKEKYELQFRRQADTYQVQITRELREMASSMAELEIELESMERQHAVDRNELEIVRKGQYKSDESLQSKIDHWKMIESQFESKIAILEGRVISLEQEVLVLYSKNLELARQLGELEP